MDTAIRSGCTCITCRLVFAGVDLQKQHYGSEWHRYNVKRQIAELPPITEEQFEAKIKSHQESEEENAKKKRKPKKQQQAAQRSSDDDGEMEDAGQEEEEEEDNYDEKNAIPETVCLFCSTTSTSFDNNLMHMSKNHGFFIPDSNYCCDIEGLIKYLGLKVGAGNYCIHCPNKRFRDLNSCQLHMRDKAHCQFNVEGDRVVEYLDFYDYGELLTETDDDEGDDAAIDLGYSLILPSGATLGHRALMRYYKQKLRPLEDQPPQLSKSAKRLQQNQLKALGWTGTSGAVAVQRARDFKYMKRVIDKNTLRRGIHLNKLFKSRGRDDQQ